MERAPVEGTKMVITCGGLQALIHDLVAQGYRVLGPTVRDGAIIYDAIAHVDDLPAGWTDRQDAGRYHLERREDDALFGFAVGPHSWKQLLHPAVETLWRARNVDEGVTITTERTKLPRFAFIGVRACEIKAIRIQDQVFCKGPHPDTAYELRRQDAFIVAVNCGQAGGTCFCVSMETGPKADAGFDLALTELVDENRHEFLVEVGSEAAAEIFRQVPHRPATDAEVAAAEAVVAHAASQMGRTLQIDGIKDLLLDNLNRPRTNVAPQTLGRDAAASAGRSIDGCDAELVARRCAGVVATACTQGKRAQDGKPQGVVSGPITANRACRCNSQLTDFERMRARPAIAALRGRYCQNGLISTNAA